MTHDTPPKRIWACPPDIFDGMGFWQDQPHPDGTEYTLTSHADAMAAQAMLVEQAADAVKSLWKWDDEGWQVHRPTQSEAEAAIRNLAPIDGLALVRELREQVERRGRMHMSVVKRMVQSQADRDRLAAANAVLEAKVARLLEVVIRVKPLDWQEGRFCGQDMFYAETPSGTWMVVCYSGRGFRWAVCDSQGNNSDEDWSTPELAKAAAQGDYDAEVRAALSAAPTGEDENG